MTGYHDITPRMGAAYDLFGNGKTSMKVNVSKYLQAANNDAQYTIANPAVTFQQTTNRSWTDSNGNSVVDCNLMSTARREQHRDRRRRLRPVAEPELRQPVQHDRRSTPTCCTAGESGPYDWQFSVGVQHEILPRVSVDVGYSRALVGQPLLHRQSRARPRPTSTRRRSPRRPIPNLPNGGGYPVTFVTRNARSPIGAVDNYYTFAERLRRRHHVLARRRLHRERAHQQRHHLPGRHQHRPRRARLLRRSPTRCRSSS